MEPTTLKFSIEAVSGSSVQADLRFEDDDKAPAAAPAAAPVPAAAPAPQFGGLTQAEREAAWNDFRGLDMAEAAGAWDTLTALASAAGPDHQERGLLIGQWEDGAAAAPSAAAHAQAHDAAVGEHGELDVANGAVMRRREHVRAVRRQLRPRHQLRPLLRHHHQ